LQRHEVWEFPYDAVREAVLNALVHRDYTSVGRIQIRVYNDRLVISNPGSLPEALTISDLFKEHNSFPRNPAIAQTIYYTQLIEKWGTGTIRMRNACRAEGAPDPEFEARPNEFIVTLRKSGLPQSTFLPTLTAEERQILEWAAGRAGFTVSDCMNALQMTRRHTRYLIQRLVQKELLAPHGENRQRRYSA
jgi:ATP-dependent DNA helicase RecG